MSATIDILAILLIYGFVQEHFLVLWTFEIVYSTKVLNLGGRALSVMSENCTVLGCRASAPNFD